MDAFSLRLSHPIIAGPEKRKKKTVRMKDASLGNELPFPLTFRMDEMHSDLSPGLVSLVESRSMMACSN